MGEQWLLLKHGLFYRPDNKGYTGIRDEAGRYSRAEADQHSAAGGKVVREIDAPEFLPAAYNDLVIKHLMDQKAALVKALQFYASEFDANGHIAREALLRVRVGGSRDA